MLGDDNISCLYLIEQGASMGFTGHRVEVRHKDDLLHSVPIENIEHVEIFGNIQISTQCIQEFLKRGIQVNYYSISGSYFGRLISTNHVNVHRQRLQSEIYDDINFRLDFSKKIINAKILNQVVVLQRYSRNSDISIKNEISDMKQMQKKINTNCSSIEQLIGYEGRAAKSYFHALGRLVNPEFSFTKRTRRPPKDEFNSMISLGYSVLLNEIYGKIESKGLNPYFGILHKDREKHPTLASDLMEEWRAVLVDTTVMGLINGKEINLDDFYTTEDVSGIFLRKDAFKTFIRKLEAKLSSSMRYLDYIDYCVSFRRGLDLQVNQLVKSIEAKDVSLYHPVRIR